ncbi:hypothetical protein [Thermotalea metallivorans]|uniref:Membrane-bound protein LytA n=1 Tax=Thermotalea metallivorans TaxID=520762 RepID=A0A140LDJ6_9FIRM|nr:hypothetical protein [Thermotalea metallivorans]KXG78621.1 Membrane-bound protein LytA [Thermotalea metallivorans]
MFIDWYFKLRVLAGCGFKKPEEQKGPETVANQPVQNEEPQDVKRVAGVHVGQIDGNSIEVQMDGEPMVFCMVDIGKAIDDIEEGQKVSVEYEEGENGQLLLVKIEKID